MKVPPSSDAVDGDVHSNQYSAELYQDEGK